MEFSDLLKQLAEKSKADETQKFKDSWSKDPKALTHLGGHNNTTEVDPVVLDYILKQRPHIKRFLDIGCGPGGMLHLARARGLDALGIDGDPSLYQQGSILTHDYSRGSFPGDGYFEHFNPFDLVWSVEFVEHVHARFIPNIMSSFAMAPVLLLSHALPGQGGYHHVNEQPSSYWIDVLASYGWTLNDTDTKWIQSNASNFYLRRTGMLFTRKQQTEEKGSATWTTNTF